MEGFVFTLLCTKYWRRVQLQMQNYLSLSLNLFYVMCSRECCWAGGVTGSCTMVLMPQYVSLLFRKFPLGVVTRARFLSFPVRASKIYRLGFARKMKFSSSRSSIFPFLPGCDLRGKVFVPLSLTET